MNANRLLRIIFLSSLISIEYIVLAQNYSIQVDRDQPYIENKHFKQGTSISPDGKTITLNNFYYSYDGKPMLPVMGEIHYTRYPRENWEDALLKMKSAGIKVIAAYAFWIHHEEQEGKFRFDGNRDVRYFLELCKKHGLWAFMRLGPWCHGEARNGGYPEWFQVLIKQKRSQQINNLTRPCITRYYKKLAEQFRGLYYKDGGPIIGVQLDNEVNAKGKNEPSALKYISELKTIAFDAGMDVPIYTATGWSGNVPEDDVMPTYGGYPDAPWDKSIKKLPASELYTFTPSKRVDPGVGTDLDLNEANIKKENPMAYRHPFFTVEMGGGNQVTYHRRPTFVGADMVSLIYTRLGLGANAIGYYMFHGGQHPISDDGKYTTNESTNSIYPYPNDVPLISYDFFAPISEWGTIRDYYHDFKLINTFANEFGEMLAPMYPSLPSTQPANASDTTMLRYAVRSKAGQGFLFINNYARHLNMPDFKDVSIAIQLPGETIKIPEKEMEIKSGIYAILPFNMPIDNLILKYATAQPLAIIDEKTWFFFAIPGIDPEFKFASRNITNVEASHCKVIQKNDAYYIRQITPGLDTKITIKDSNNKEYTVCILPYENARYSYKTRLNKKEYLVITNKALLNNEPLAELSFTSMSEAAFSINIYPEPKFTGEAIKKQSQNGIFTTYELQTAPWKKKIKYTLNTKEKDFADSCLALKTNPKAPSYTHVYNPKKMFLTYELSFPPDFLKNVNNVFLEFDYKGNTAQIYTQDTLIADDFYSGVPMMFGCTQHKNVIGKEKLVFQVSPLMPDYAIYFEHGTSLEFANTEHAKLNSIKPVPEYRIVLKYE